MGAGVAGADCVYRAAAIVALGSAVAALVVMCAAVRVHPWSMLGILVALPAAVIAGWHVVTRRGLARVVACDSAGRGGGTGAARAGASAGSLAGRHAPVRVLDGLGPLRAATGGATSATGQ